jgi:hypothetical protein
MNKSCRSLVNLSKLVKFIIFESVLSLVMNFCRFMFYLDIRNIQLCFLFNCSTLETFYMKPYNTKVVYNEVFYSLVIFWRIFGCVV